MISRSPLRSHFVGLARNSSRALADPSAKPLEDSIEFIVPFRPVSVQAVDRANYQAWKGYVAQIASMEWGERVQTQEPLRFTVVFLCDDRAPIDVDNVIKPLQDALLGIAFEDDVIVTDTDSHRRFVQDPLDLTDLPTLLAEMLIIGEESVYIRLEKASPAVGAYL